MVCVKEREKHETGKRASAVRAQMSVEFFVVLGFVLFAAGVLLASTESQTKGTRLLNDIAAARAVLDSQTAFANYAYFSGTGTRLVQTFFVPARVSCSNWDAANKQLYCVVAGHANNVMGEKIEAAVNFATVQEDCYKSGWIRMEIHNTDGANFQMNCVKVSS